MRDRLQRSDLREIKRLACEFALELGAAEVRVAPARTDEAAGEAMRTAFARGDFTTWRYDEEYARKASSPQNVLAGARSVLCVAMPYRTDEPPSPPLSGRVSNYAWSVDYHHRMKGLLAQVAQRIDAAAGAAVTAIACDTKPLAERAFAASAGLGWIGKHTNLIHPHAGSFVFLGRDRYDAASGARRSAAQDVRYVHAMRERLSDRCAARRLHHRRDALHRGPHAAYRCNSRSNAPARRHLGMGLRFVSNRVPAERARDGRVRAT